MNDFIAEGIKVGDRLYSMNYGWGEVIDIINNASYPIIINHYGHLRTSVSKNGKLCKSDRLQSIFWDKPKFEMPVNHKLGTVNEFDVFVNYNPGTGSCEAFKDPSDATDRLSVGEINIKGKLTFTIIE